MAVELIHGNQLTNTQKREPVPIIFKGEEYEAMEVCNPSSVCHDDPPFPRPKLLEGLSWCPQRRQVSEVGVGPVKWSSTLEAYALNYASQRAGDCQLIHSRGPYGENIYVGYGEGYSDGIDAVRCWYNEKPNYDHGSNQCLGGMDCLHYTQMVWRSSVQLGCARVQCDGSGGQYFVTCNYDPPGNMEGEQPYY